MSINYDSPPKVELKVPLFEDLTPGQQTAIENGPGWVRDPAGMMRFESLEDFTRTKDNVGQSSFSMFFIPIEQNSPNPIADVYRQYPAFQRLEIINPKLCQDLRDLYRNYSDPEWNDPAWQAKLFSAYKYMSQLVDKNDPGVMQDGKVVANFLTI